MWSPDGRRLAFVSRRDADKAAQIYVIDVGGGEAERVTEMPLGAGSVKWLPDGTRLVFVSHVIAGHESPEDIAKALEAREKNKVKARVTENRVYRFWDRWLTDDEFPHLFVVDLATKKVTDLLPGSTPPLRPAGGQRRLRHLAGRHDDRVLGQRVARALPDAQLRPVQRSRPPAATSPTSPPTTRRRTPGPCSAPTAPASRTAAR